VIELAKEIGEGKCEYREQACEEQRVRNNERKSRSALGHPW